MAVTNKRSRSSPTGLTPQQASKTTRKPSSKLETLLTGHRAAKKKLVFSERSSANLWTTQEDFAVVQFLIRKGYQEEWPKSRPLQGTLWEGVASVLAQTSKAQRTSKCHFLSQVTVSF